jgi:hypothetical protein
MGAIPYITAKQSYSLEAIEWNSLKCESTRISITIISINVTFHLTQIFFEIF